MASSAWQWVGFLFVFLLSLLRVPLPGLQAHICTHVESHSHMHMGTHMYMNTHTHNPLTCSHTRSHIPSLHLQSLCLWETVSQNGFWFWRPRLKTGVISAGLHFFTKPCHWTQSSQTWARLPSRLFPGDPLSPSLYFWKHQLFRLVLGKPVHMPMWQAHIYWTVSFVFLLFIFLRESVMYSLIYSYNDLE